VLLGAGVVGLPGGQLIAIGSARAALADDGMDTPVPRPAASGPERIDGRYLVRFLTLDAFADGGPRLLEHASFLLREGEQGEAEGTAVAPIAPIGFEAWLGQGNASYSIRSGTMTMSSTVDWQRTGTYTEAVYASPRSVGAMSTATMPDTVYPPFFRPRTILTVDPAPYGVEEVPFREIWVPEEGNRIQDAFAGSSSAGRDTSGPGPFRFLGALSLFAWCMLGLAGTGAALLAPQPGAGVLAVFLLAPLLVVASDRIAFASERAALADPDVAVRTSAAVGLRESVLFARSGTEALGERKKEEGSDGVAAIVLRTVPVNMGGRERRNLLTAEDFLR
jgi:hypothetical protein